MKKWKSEKKTNKKPHCQASDSAFWKTDSRDYLKEQEETLVLSLKGGINFKSIKRRELKTEDPFCITFIWLIISYRLNLLL